MSWSGLPEQVENRISPEPNSGCWLWTGWITDGYGVVQNKNKTRRTHNVVYETLIGPIPKGLELDHLCRVRCCCNPTHLEPVTKRVNILRGEGRGAKAARLVCCTKGHPFIVGNIDNQKNGKRRCSACRREYMKNYMRIWRHK